jgi:hypothetical protein
VGAKKREKKSEEKSVKKSKKSEQQKRCDREQKQQRYAEEPEYRETIKARNRASHLENKDARNARRRQRYATDPEFRATRRARRPSQRKDNLKKYGLSLDQYGAKLARQGGVCVICLKPSGQGNPRPPRRKDGDDCTGLR